MRTHVSQSFEFSLGGNAQQIQVTGWSGPEQHHTWAIGKRSALVLRDIVAPHGYFLEIMWEPFLSQPYRPAQQIVITAADHRISPYLLTQHETAAFYCPSPPKGETSVLVTLDLPGAAPANEVCDVPETRELTVAFRRLRVLTLLEPPPVRLVNMSEARIWIEQGLQVVPASEVSAPPDMGKLFSLFELLAGNCDLGLVMRALGHEQLSLLRFAGATPEVAMRGLETGFEGIGVRLSTEIADNPIREWMIRDGFGLRFHTHQSSDVMTADAIVKRQRLHINFLRRKFLEDLELGEKIFVYADHLRPRTFETALALFLTLNRSRKCRMLWVCPNFGEMAVGRVDEMLPGFARGSLDQFGGPMDAGHIAVSGWLNVLFNASVVFGRSLPALGFG